MRSERNDILLRHPFWSGGVGYGCHLEVDECGGCAWTYSACHEGSFSPFLPSTFLLYPTPLLAIHVLLLPSIMSLMVWRAQSGMSKALN